MEHNRMVNNSYPSPLPVVNRKMRIISVTLILLGLVLIVTGLLMGTYKKVPGEIFVLVGAATMASSYIFKYYAYKRNKDHHPRVVS